MKPSLLSVFRILFMAITLTGLAHPPVMQAAVGKLGAMGDSLSDEYWDSGVSSYATNWPDLVVRYRAVDMGPTAAQAGTNSWGSPRNAGYKCNWALSGATSASLLSAGQHTGLAAQAASEGVTTAVLEIGSNDFNPESSSAYLNIYLGFWSSAQIQSYANQTVANIETALATVRAAGISVVLVNLLDPGETPAAASIFTNGSYRDRVATAIQKVNAGLKDLAQKYQVPLVDFYAFQKAIFGPNTSRKSTLTVGNVSIALRSSDPGPPTATPTAAFVSDGFHPNTVLQAIFANLVFQALNSAYGAGVPLFSEREMLGLALIPYGGSDTLLSQIGPYSSYVFLPTLPRFTGITASNDNVTLSFSTVSNQVYLLQSRDALAAGTWTTVTNNLPGTGGIITLTYAVDPPVPSRFFRIRQLP